MRTIRYILAAAAVVMFLPACVTDTIYNTDHPQQGKVVTITADWGDRGTGIQKPASYKIVTQGLDATANSDNYNLDKLFAPGSYSFRIHNTPDGITVTGNTAVVATVQAPAGQAGTFIEPLPGWLLSGSTTATLEPDHDYNLTVKASQHIRQLTLVIEPEGGAADNITAITATLSGVAATWDIDAGAPQGDPANVAVDFTKQTAGEYAGRWTATVRLLGVTGTAQKLTGEVTVSGQPDTAPLESDLTASLAGFNGDKKKPLTLKATVTVEPEPGPDPEIPAGFTATIKDWEKVTGGAGIAN